LKESRQNGISEEKAEHFEQVTERVIKITDFLRIKLLHILSKAFIMSNR